MPPDKLIFGKGKKPSQGDAPPEVSIKPIPERSDRKSGTGWSWGKKKTRDTDVKEILTESQPDPPQQEPVIQQPVIQQPIIQQPVIEQPVALPPPDLFKPSSPFEEPAADFSSSQQPASPTFPPPFPTATLALPGVGAPPPPPPPPRFDWASPTTAPPPPSPPLPSDLVLPDLNDGQSPSQAINRPPFLSTTPLDKRSELPLERTAPTFNADETDSLKAPPGLPTGSAGLEEYPRPPRQSRAPARSKIVSEQQAEPERPLSWQEKLFGRAQQQLAKPTEPNPEPKSESSNLGRRATDKKQDETPPLSPAKAFGDVSDLLQKKQQSENPNTIHTEESAPPVAQPSSPPTKSISRQGHDEPRDESGQALPKPKSFGQLSSKKGSAQAPVAPDSRQPGHSKAQFTVIGDSSTPTRSKRLPFPDESIDAMRPVQDDYSRDTRTDSHYTYSYSKENFPVSDPQPFSADEPFPEESSAAAFSGGVSEVVAPAVLPPVVSQYDLVPQEPDYQSNEDNGPVDEFDAIARKAVQSFDYNYDRQSLGSEPSTPQDSYDQSNYAPTYNPPESPTLSFDEDVLEGDISRGIPDSKQFREACLATSTADSAMGNENYQIALPLFKKAYRLFKQAAASDSQEFGSCLHKLADCHYHEEQFKDALTYYEEFNDWSSKRSARPDVLRIVVLLKRARTYQKLDRIDDCDKAFDMTVSMANQALPPSHPLFSVVYSSYIAMLEMSGNDPERLERLKTEFSQKMARSSRQINIPNELEVQLSAWTTVDKLDMERLERQRQLKLSRSMFQQERTRSEYLVEQVTGSNLLKVVLICGALVVFVGCLVLIALGAMQFAEQKESQSAAKAQVDPGLADLVGKSFTSADGLKKLVIQDDGKAAFTFGDTLITISAKAGAPKVGLEEDFKQWAYGKRSYVLEQIEEGFRDPDGTVLYDPDSRSLAITKDMKRIADLANYYYSRHQKKYPKKRKDFNEMGPDVKWENPLGHSLKPVIKVHEFEKYDGDVAFSEMLDKFKKGKPIFEQDAKGSSVPGLIECMALLPFDQYHDEDGVSFMLRAYDAKSHFISSSYPGTMFVICQKNGIDHQVYKPSEVTMPIRDQIKTTSFFKLMH